MLVWPVTSSALPMTFTATTPSPCSSGVHPGQASTSLITKDSTNDPTNYIFRAGQRDGEREGRVYVTDNRWWIEIRQEFCGIDFKLRRGERAYVCLRYASCTRYGFLIMFYS